MNEFLVKLKEWWATLALREKRAISIGMVSFILFIVYQWIWTPYREHIVMMREQIIANQKTLSWMRAADEVIKRIETQTKGKNTPPSLVVLLSQTQKKINQLGLEQFLKHLKQVSSETIEIQFQKVEFDKLVKLLAVMIKEENISITRLSVLADNSPGLVNANIIIKLN